MANEKTYEFNVLVHKEDDTFILECVEFGTVSQGKTMDEAIKNVIEATELYIEDMTDEEIMKKSNQKVGFMPLQVQHQGSNPLMHNA